MTAAQKAAKANFKKAIEYRQKTGVSLKEAFAHVYGKKVGAAPKKKAAKKIGALPVGFKGSILGIKFKIVNQYNIYNDVSAIMEDIENGSTIVVFDGKGNAIDKADKIASYVKLYGKYRNASDITALKVRLNKFSNLMQKEVKEFNAGKKKTIKKQPLVIEAPKNIITTKKRLPSVIKLINKSIDKVYKQSKKLAPKKASKLQTGKSNIEKDKLYQAKKPGKRKSASGNTYYEYRSNRSDKGKLLGIHKDTKSHNVNIRVVSGIHKTKRLQNQEIIKKYNDTQNEITKQEQYLQNWNFALKSNKGFPANIQIVKNRISEIKKLIAELKTHSRELKKYI